MITYVTAFLDLNDDCVKDRSVETCFQQFEPLRNLGINVVVFLSKKFKTEANTNTKHIHYEFIDVDELETYKETYAIDNLRMPYTPAPNKDTKNFMILMNAKIEFVKKAIDLNPFQTTHFAWIDFSITYVFRSMDATLKRLKEDSIKDWQSCLVFPGCWEKGIGYSNICNTIHWRFCGGFFMGDAESLTTFSQMYRSNYSMILRDKQTMLWEVNIWAILEQEYGWNPNWFKGDHNDTIVHIPQHYLNKID